MTKTALPRLLLALSTDTITADLERILHRDCLPVLGVVSPDQFFQAVPVFDEEDEILQEITADKFLFILAMLSAHLSADQYQFRITGADQLYSPSSSVYFKYIRLSTLSMFSSSLLLDQFPS